MTCRWIAFVACGLLVTMPAVAAENVWSTESFQARKPDWDQLIGATIRLEGRVSLLGGGQLRLLKCEVPIRVADTSTRSLHGKKAVEISGRLKKENGKLYFDADQVQAISTDLELYESRSAKLRNPKAAEWYELGDWAMGRATFYDDADMKKKARSAYDKGISADWRGLAPDDATARFELAARVSRYSLPDTRRLELIHEGNRILWNQTLKARQTDREVLAAFIKKLAEDMPGCTQPVANSSEQLKKRYDDEPLATYRESSAEDRRQLHRFFYSAVLLKSIIDTAEADGRNGDVIGRQIEEHVPEARQVAEMYRGQRMKWRLDHATTSTRQEIEQLAADFTARKQPDLARQAVQQWLKSREERLRQDGPLGLLQLADEYIALLKDEPRAIELLSEANRQDPGFSDVLDRFKSLGYAKEGHRWVKSDVPASTAPQITTVDAPQAVAVGMNAAAVRNSMGGSPGSLARVITRLKVSEVWSYGQQGTSRLIIRLEGTRQNDLRVIDIKSE
jgi:hypothetical protein